MHSQKIGNPSLGPVLVVLAAGMGSRYGGLKQLEGVGPSGETILEYSLHDALRSGFSKAVFVIRRDMRPLFDSELAPRFPHALRYDVAYQGVEDVPAGVTVPSERTKPWGTAHAVWCAREYIDAPFAVINADDFYGRSAFRALGDCLQGYQKLASERYCLVGYALGATLTEAGTVSRGVCSVDARSELKSIVEHTKIAREGDRIVDRGEGTPVELPGDSMVSMNCWGFTQPFLRRLDEELHSFFMQPESVYAAKECYLPSAVTRGLGQGVPCEVLPGGTGWCGVTYPSDRASVESHLAELVASGEYASPLR